MTFPTPHIGHSIHGLFFTRWIVNPMLNLLKRTMKYPGFEPGTFGLAVIIANHYTIYPCLSVLYFHKFQPTILKFCILKNYYLRSNRTIVFLDPLSRNSDIEFGFSYGVDTWLNHWKKTQTSTKS
jgi:hypothetical protein